MCQWECLDDLKNFVDGKLENLKVLNISDNGPHAFGSGHGFWKLPPPVLHLLLVTEFLFVPNFKTHMTQSLDFQALPLQLPLNITFQPPI